VEDIGHSVDDTNVTATLDDFRKIEMRVGRIVAVDDFPEARNRRTSSRSISVRTAPVSLQPRCDSGMTSARFWAAWSCA